MRITLPFALLMGDNHRLIPASVGRHARLISNAKYRDAKERLRLYLLTQKTPLMVGPCAVHCMFYFPDRRKRDQTNYAKFLHDCMSGICYHDDSQIVDARQTKAYDKHNPRVEIEISAPAITLTPAA